MKRSVTIALLSAILLSSYTALPDQASASAAATAGSVTKGHINSGVNLRTKPSLSGKVIGLVKKGSQVTVLDRSTKYFYKVKTQGGTVGYVSANPKYITVSSGSSAPAPKPETSGTVSRQIEQVIQTGMKYLGTPYEFVRTGIRRRRLTAPISSDKPIKRRLALPCRPIRANKGPGSRTTAQPFMTSAA
ncbi:hypothetical protein HMSSN036_47960 [Paenibacillus macerans]|nr:hypothetical protein HMSSN036_47960 [Paenibacillus macerans]